MTWKKPLLLFPILVSGLIVAHCDGSGDSPKESGSHETKDTLVAGTPFNRPLRHDTNLIIAHTIEEYDLWKTAFDEARSAREKFGIETRYVYRGTVDSNMTMVFTTISSTKRAREYISSEDRQNIKADAAGSGDINTYWLRETLRHTNPVTDTLRMFMSFKVVSYDRWERAFLADYKEQSQRDFHVLSVMRGIDEPNTIYMLFAVNDPLYVEKMEKNNAFRMKMLASGVVSYPVTYKLNEMPI